MSQIKDQYEAYPYPARDPADEAKRLVMGSPSMPFEIDHFLFGGRRDWSTSFRVLVAGGGTGDGLIQIAQLMNGAGRDADITYIDLSVASREIAEARARARGLTGITFLNGSLLTAPDLGQFDYIDCCGVLHHLPEPQEGFDALAAAMAPQGGMGMMVYAPYGRSGVYPLQEALGALLRDLKPEKRLKAGREIFAKTPPAHPFQLNPNLNDHKRSDAGFYDLLLHTQDRAYGVADLAETLDRAGLGIASFTEPALYELERYLPPGFRLPKGFDRIQKMAMAERLSGCMHKHTLYVTHRERAASVSVTKVGNDDDIPHLRPDVSGSKFADVIASGGTLNMNTRNGKLPISLPRPASRAVAAINGARSLAQIRGGIGMNKSEFKRTWAAIDDELRPWGLLHYTWLMHGK
ncbi:MAG: class I SAM-dependent methyltransferase [Pseudomonadota bacterium]